MFHTEGHTEFTNYFHKFTENTCVQGKKRVKNVHQVYVAQRIHKKQLREEVLTLQI